MSQRLFMRRHKCGGSSRELVSINGHPFRRQTTTVIDILPKVERQASADHDMHRKHHLERYSALGL